MATRTRLMVHSPRILSFTSHRTTSRSIKPCRLLLESRFGQKLPILPRSTLCLNSVNLPRQYSSKINTRNGHNLDPLSSNKPDTSSGNTYTRPAEQLSQQVTPAEKAAYEDALAKQRRKQARAPWLREGPETAPADQKAEGGDKESDENGQSSSGSDASLLDKEDPGKHSKGGKDSGKMMVARGKLLTTPSRLLKLIVPMASVAEMKRVKKENESEDEGLEPLALLVHPQQPLSYLERLIQAELPMVGEEGAKHVPEVAFRAPDSESDDGDEEGVSRGRPKGGKDDEKLETMIIDGKRVKIGKISGGKAEVKTTEEDADDSEATGFVRWSSSTETGDFIRDAARTGHFALEIEGNPRPILVSVPNFEDRTFYLRMRLRQKGREIARLADVKRECDDMAEKGAKRIAITGGGILIGYWWIVYLCTFKDPDLGWDVMEPVTYLVGLSTLIAGYIWFLVHNRQVSYRSAMNFTISRRQSMLYEKKGFDLHRWEDLVQEGNKLRREIKLIAEEYDVTWNEKEEDPQTEKAIKALEEEKKKKKRAKGKDSDEEEEKGKED